MESEHREIQLPDSISRKEKIVGRLNRLNQSPRVTVLVLLVLGIFYFLLFIPPNATGALDRYMISLFRPDEFAQYNHPLRMLTPGRTFSETIYRFIAYQHYYYGFPFYLASALALFLLKISVGLGSTTLNMLILRQAVSVLPMILAVGILVYLSTRFRSFLLSASLFIFLLLVPAVVENNLWWHPESLVFFFIVMVFFFLDRDNLRFGTNFYLAAIATGLAISTKLLGLFFFLTIPLYILIGLRLKQINWKAAIKWAVLFVLLMVLTFVLTEPFLAIPGERQAAWIIQLKQQRAMSAGWSVFYEKGLASWLPIITHYYGSIPFIILSFIALGIGIWKGPNRSYHLLTASFIIPFCTYILFFIAIKPKHFFLPTSLILFASLISLEPFFKQILFSPTKFDLSLTDADHRIDALKHGHKFRLLPLLALILTLIIIGWQFYSNLTTSVTIYRDTLNRETNSHEISFWYELEDSYLKLLPQDQSFVIFRDVKMYIPDRPHWDVKFRWELSDYDIIKRLQPDLIVLWRQRINDYTQREILEQAINPNQMRQAQKFYSDAKKGEIAGFRLLFENDTGLAFVREELYEIYFQGQE